METVRRAVIDVGTNSIKLLVADVAGQRIEPVWEGSRQTRLGRGFYQTRRLQTSAIIQTASAVVEFASEARKHRADELRVIATSAAREAINAEELRAAIEHETGLKVEILSGAEEADLVFAGVRTDAALANETFLLLDVGGGSTEFVLGQGERKDFRASFPLGSVRLMETYPPSDPPTRDEMQVCRKWIEKFLKTEVRSKLAAAGSRVMDEPAGSPGDRRAILVGTGGTATILARMEGQMRDFDREAIEKMGLKLSRLRWHVEHLWGLPLVERRNVLGLPASRADVILTGSLIFETVMEAFGFSELRVSTRGLRFAALLDAGTQLNASGKRSEQTTSPCASPNKTS